MQLISYLQNCFFLSDATIDTEDTEPNKSFIFKNIIYYIVLGTIVKANTSDPVNGSIEMVMRIIVTLIFVSSLLYSIKRLQLPLFSNLLLAVIICENFFMTLAVGKEFLALFSLLPESNQIIQYFGWILLIWHVMVLIYILKKIFPFSFFINLLFSGSYYEMMSNGTALFMEVLF